MLIFEVTLTVSLVFVVVLSAKLFELLSLGSELLVLILGRRDEEFASDVFIEVLLDDRMLPLFVIFVNLGDFSSVDGCLVTLMLSVQVFLDRLDLGMLVEFGDHGVEDGGLSLLTEVDSVLVDLLLSSHLKVGKLERLATLIALAYGLLLVV